MTVRLAIDKLMIELDKLVVGAAQAFLEAELMHFLNQSLEYLIWQKFNKANPTWSISGKDDPNIPVELLPLVLPMLVNRADNVVPETLGGVTSNRYRYIIKNGFVADSLDFAYLTTSGTIPDTTSDSYNMQTGSSDYYGITPLAVDYFAVDLTILSSTNESIPVLLVKLLRIGSDSLPAHIHSEGAAGTVTTNYPYIPNPVYCFYKIIRTKQLPTPLYGTVNDGKPIDLIVLWDAVDGDPMPPINYANTNYRLYVLVLWLCGYTFKTDTQVIPINWMAEVIDVAAEMALNSIESTRTMEHAQVTRQK